MCSVLQRVCAVCCSVCVQCLTVCCSVLQCVAVCCSALQCVAVCSRRFLAHPHSYKPHKTCQHHSIVPSLLFAAMCCSLLQCDAVCCSVVQCVAHTSKPVIITQSSDIREPETNCHLQTLSHRQLGDICCDYRHTHTCTHICRDCPEGVAVLSTVCCTM